MAELIATTAVDDCWNRIGVSGDRSCSLLEQYVHCHNCDVYADNAKRILDRYQLRQTDDSTSQPPLPALTERTATESIIVFRLGEEWLGLSVQAMSQVGPVQRIHSLPHRRSPAVLGLSNLRGTLVACMSLGTLLGIDDGGTEQGRAVPRMLIIGNATEGNVVCRVDEIDGIYRIPLSLLESAGSGKFSRAIFQWQSRSVRLLDDNQLLQAINRNLA